MTVKQLRDKLERNICADCKAECKAKPCKALEMIAFHEILIEWEKDDYKERSEEE